MNSAARHCRFMIAPSQWSEPVRSSGLLTTERPLISAAEREARAFRNEDLEGCSRFAREFAQCPGSPCRNRMQASIFALSPAYMKSSHGKGGLRHRLANSRDWHSQHRCSWTASQGGRETRGLSYQVFASRGRASGGLYEPTDSYQRLVSAS